MFRVDTTSSVGVYGGFAPAGTPGHFSSGNPTVGQRGTVPGCDWFEGVQEELMSLLTAGGLVEQKGNLRQIYQSILAMQLLIDTGAGGANALICAPLVPFDNLNLNTIVWLRPAATNTGPATVNIGVGGNVNLVRPDGTPLQPGDYTAQQPFPVIYTMGSWQMLLQRMRQQLGGAVNLTVNSATGNDQTGNLTAPFQTLQAAYDWTAQNIDAADNTVTVNCAGNFTQQLVAQVPIMGINQPDSLVFNFAAGSTLNTPNDCFLCSGAGSVLNVRGGLTLSSSGGHGIRTFDDANVAISGITFGTFANGAHILGAENARVRIDAPGYAINGSASAHYYLYDAARVRPGALPTGMTYITLSGNPHFSIAFANVGQLSLVSIPSNAINFTGTATGTTYLATTNAVINTSGGGASYFPGNAAGAVSTGAQYV